MSKVVDARGLACPAPVVSTKKALQQGEGGPVVVLVDNETARDNVRRFAEKQGCTVAVAAEGDAFRLTLSRGAATAVAGDGETARAGAAEARPVLYVNADVVGQGDEALGRILARGLFKALLEADVKPATAIFVNRGIFLTTEGSEVLDSIQGLEAAGCEVLSCGTCLDYYDRKDKLLVGRATDFFTVADTLTKAHRIINP